MSTDPYAPETIDVKVAYCTSFDPGFAHKVMAHTVAEMTTGHAADFDRWLEKHDREVRAQELRDAAADDKTGWALRTWLNTRADRLTATTEEPTT